MDKILIAYYSRTGSNETAAKALNEELKCDIERIIETKGGSGMFFCAMSALFKRTAKINPIEKDPCDYDLVVVGAPIWAGNLPPASRTYIKENKTKFKKVAFLSVSGKGSENKKALLDFESSAGKNASSSIMLTENEVKNSAFKEKISAFAEEIRKI